MSHLIPPDVTSTAQTIGAVTGDGAAVPIPLSGVLVVQVIIRGQNAAGDVASRVLTGTYINIAGTVSLIGAVLDTMALQSSVPLALTLGTLVIVGTTVVPRVTGVAAQTVNWTFKMSAA